MRPDHPLSSNIFFQFSMPKSDGKGHVPVDNARLRGTEKRVCPSWIRLNGYNLFFGVEIHAWISLVAAKPRPPSDVGNVSKRTDSRSMQPPLSLNQETNAVNATSVSSISIVDGAVVTVLLKAIR